MAKPRPIAGLGPDVALREAAGRTVRVRTAEVFEYQQGVLDTSDIERVHDMRVATRRLRAALEVYKPCFDPDFFKPLLREVKDLADALGARRDPDVALAAIEAIAARLPATTRPGVDAFEDELHADQAAGNVQLEQAVGHAGESQLEARLLELAAAADADSELTFGEHATEMVDQRRRRLAKRGRRALESGKPGDLHDTRIAAKRLRYLYEITEPVFGEVAKRGAKTARGLQDLLGDLHDCDVMSERIRGRAEAVSTSDPRYVGFEALASYMEARRRVLHRQFVDTWPEIEL